MQARWRRNLFLLYGYSFFQMFLICIPILVPFWQSNGLTLQQIFTLQGLFGAVLILCDVPAGYFADLFGRKPALVVGSIISLLGFQMLWWGTSFFHFVIYELILGVGLSLQSGCDVAILYNTLEKLELTSKRASYLGRRIFAMQFGESLASLAGGALAVVSLRLPMIVNAITPIGAVVFACLLFEDQSQRLSSTSHLGNMKMIARALFGHSRLLTYVIIAYIFYSFATYCAVWTLQPYWKTLGLSYSVFGYLWAFNCLLVGIVGHYAHRIEKLLGSTWSVVIIAVAPVVGYFGMGTLSGWLGIMFMACFPICRGLNMVVFQDALNSRVPAEIRATTNSIGSLGMRMMFLGFGPWLGQMIDSSGPAYALRFMAYVYLAGLFVVALPLLSQRRFFVS